MRFSILLLICMTGMPQTTRDSLLNIIDLDYNKTKTAFNRKNKAEYEYKILPVGMFPYFCINDSIPSRQIKHGVRVFKDTKGRTHFQAALMYYIKWMPNVEPDRKTYVLCYYILEKGIWVKQESLKINLVLTDKKKIWYGCE